MEPQSLRSKLYKIQQIKQLITRRFRKCKTTRNNVACNQTLVFTLNWTLIGSIGSNLYNYNQISGSQMSI
jgi:hypothetical protein